MIGFKSTMRLGKRVRNRLARMRFEYIDGLRYDLSKIDLPHVFEEDITGRDIVRIFGYTPAIVRWVSDHGDETLRLDYDLTEDSIVMDVGGYKGTWAAEIDRRYKPTLHIFEPVQESYEHIQEVMVGSKCHIHGHGLGASDRIAEIGGSGIGASLLNTDGATESIRIRDIVGVMDELGIEFCDLIKINIEGAEYELLTRMIDANILHRFRDIQIQFHRWFAPSELAVAGRREIRRTLRKSHRLTYDYPFVWENWRKN